MLRRADPRAHEKEIQRVGPLVLDRTSRSLDGALGCPVAGADAADGCFGLQPEYVLRLAVMNVAGEPLLIWARTDAESPDAAFLASFEVMLRTVDFR